MSTHPCFRLIAIQADAFRRAIVAGYPLVDAREYAAAEVARAKREREEAERSPSPEYYRSTVSREVLTLDDLVDCERCDGSGEIALEWRDAYTRRLVHEVETCPTCEGWEVVEQRLTHGAYLPYAVEPIA